MSVEFTQNDIDHFLYLVAKEYKKSNRKGDDAELILVGGVAILLNYHFRANTMDFDAIIKATSVMKDAINRVTDSNNLPNFWLNSDFIRTSSYSPKIALYSKFYRRFCNCLNVRTISKEYLLAMKLRAMRNYKHDLSDVVGIIKEQEEMLDPISIEQISKAYECLYDTEIPQESYKFLEEIYQQEDLEEYFYSMQDKEEANRGALLKAEEKYGDVINDENVLSFIDFFHE